MDSQLSSRDYGDAASQPRQAHFWDQCRNPVVKNAPFTSRDARLVRPPQAMKLYKTVLQHLALIAAVAGHLSQVSLQNSDNLLILTIQPCFAAPPAFRGWEAAAP